MTKKVITIDDYSYAIDEIFGIPQVMVTPVGVYNYIIYNRTSEIKDNANIIKLLNKALDDVVISFDVKRFVSAILSTRNGDLIKKLLNTIFNKIPWSDSESYIAVSYLLQRNFMHNDLKNLLSSQKNQLYEYLYMYCMGGKWKKPENIHFIEQCGKLQISTITMHHYFLYLKSILDSDILLSHAYFKTFFDRLTAELVFNLGLRIKGNLTIRGTIRKNH